MEIISARLFQDILTARFFELKCSEQDISLKNFLDELEKYVLLTGLDMAYWNQRRASRLLKINEKTMSLKIKRYRLKSSAGSSLYPP